MHAAPGNYLHILWDFDGVIMDSNPIRDQGFEQIFAAFDAAKVAQLMTYHRANGGLSRFVKIRYFFEQVLQTPVTEATVQEYAARFSTLMKQLLCNPALLIHDSLDYIKAHAQQKQFHLVSASAEEELKFVCEQLQLSQYFVSIHGSPTSKKDNLHRLMPQWGYTAADTCYIGDSHNDAQAAEANGLPFFGYNSPSLEANKSLAYIYSFAQQRYRSSGKG